MPKVVTKTVPQHTVDRLSLRAAKTDDNAQGRAKGTQSPYTQWINSGLRALKTDNMLRVVPGKKVGLDMQQIDMSMVVPKTTLAHSGQTLV